MRPAKKFLAVLLAAGILNGCSVPDIYVKEEVEDVRTMVQASQMASDTYYIKDGAYFYLPYRAGTTFRDQVSDKPSPSSRLIFLTGGEEWEVPTLYKGEYIVFQSQTVRAAPLKIERFKDLGWSPGLIGLTMREGIITVDRKKNVMSGTATAESIGRTFAAGVTDFEVLSIEGLEEAALSRAGTLFGIGQGEPVRAETRNGTFFNSIRLTPDVHFFESSEILVISDLYETSLGYTEYAMPLGAESGYYYLPGRGLFRYLDVPRTDAPEDLLTVDYNKKNDFEGVTHSLDDFITQEDRSFSIDLEGDRTEAAFLLDVPSGSAVEEAVCVLPDGKEVMLEKDRAEVRPAEEGQYTVRVRGYNLGGVSVSMKEGSLKAAPTPSLRPTPSPTPAQAASPSPEPTGVPTPTPAPTATPSPTPSPTEAPADTYAGAQEVYGQGQTDGSYGGGEAAYYTYEVPIYSTYEVPECEPMTEAEQSTTLPG